MYKFRGSSAICSFACSEKIYA